MTVTPVPSGKFASMTRTDATVDLALLICAGRQSQGGAATTVADIREQGKDYSKFDSHNLPTIVQNKDDLWIVSGSGASRALKLRKDGWAKAGAAVRRLVGG